MEIKEIQKKYRNVIILGGLIAGLIGILDASNYYDIGLESMGMFFPILLLVMVGISGWTYYELFMNYNKRKTRRPPQNQQTQQQQPQPRQARGLEDIRPPEMKNK